MLEKPHPNPDPLQTEELAPTPKIIEEILSIDINTLNIDNITEIANKIQQNKENIRIYTLNSKDTEVLNKLKIVINKVSEIYKERINSLKPKEITTESIDLDQLDRELESRGSLARIDRSIEGGVIKTDITQEDLEYLQTMDTAIERFRTADTTTPYYISDTFKKLSQYWTPPQLQPLNAVVINAGGTTEVERNKLVEDMKSLGYRELTVAELTATAIKRPELFKKYPNPIFNSYTKHQVGKAVYSPFFYWHGNRWLGGLSSSDDWNGLVRFLFVKRSI